MTNEEREALIAQGWTPPVPVDPDTFEARAIVNQNIYKNVEAMALDAIKRGRVLERREAKPGMVWKEHKKSTRNPVPSTLVTVKFSDSHYETGPSFRFDWLNVTHYAIITPPEDKA